MMRNRFLKSTILSFIPLFLLLFLVDAGTGRCVMGQSRMTGETSDYVPQPLGRLGNATLRPTAPVGRSVRSRAEQSGRESLDSTASAARSAPLVAPDDDPVGFAHTGAKPLRNESSGAVNAKNRYANTGARIGDAPFEAFPNAVRPVSGTNENDHRPTVVSGNYTDDASGDSFMRTVPNHLADRAADRGRPLSEPQQPVLDPFHPPIRTASIQGITPGISSQQDLDERWGLPRDMIRTGEQIARLYSMDGLNHIEILLKDEIVQTITVLLDDPFPEEQVRESFRGELQRAKAVMIPNENGEIIGEVFPEKGVLFLFAPTDSKKPGIWVNQIGIEPVTAEPFVLRAEAQMTEQPTEALRDLLDATRLDPEDAKAFALLSQVQLMQGNIDAALVNCEQAIRLDEQRPAYHITLAKIFIQMNRPEEAKQYLEETILVSDRYPHEKAQACAILGDLYRTSVPPDYEAAFGYHSDAIRIAQTLQDHANSTIRLSAKETLFNAHLGAARDIAWGQWNDKEESITKWLARANEIALDPEVLKAKRISADFPLQLAITALATRVGFPSDASIEPFVQKVIYTGDELIAGTEDPILRQKYQWDTGLALYDAVQIYQIRRKYSEALKYGELTAQYMESGIVNRRSDTDLYLLGRLYFRLGAIDAIGMKNHRAAIERFDRAKPIFEKLLPKINPEELARLGETLVSMGVSYWEMNQQDEAIRLSERGLRQIEKGVKYGTADATTLIIPYSNLSTMYSRLNRQAEAEKYLELAKQLKTGANETVLR